jgi:hypothetical protein
MKTSTFLAIFLFSFQFSSAQLFEIAEDIGYSNSFSDVISLNDSTLVISGNYNLMNEFVSGAYVKAIDKNGNLLWQYYTPYNTEIRQFSKLILLPNGNIAALGHEVWCCDCSAPFLQFHIFSPSGQLLAQHSYEALEVNVFDIKATISGDMIAVMMPNSVWPATYTLRTFGLDGTELWTYDFGENPISHLVSQGSNFLAFGNTQMIAIDMNGMLAGMISYQTMPERVLNIDDERTIVLADEQVFEINSNLEANPIFFESNLFDIEDWMKNGDFLYVIAEGEIRKLDLNYEMVQCTFFEPLPYHILNSNWCNEEFCVFAGYKNYIHEDFDWISSFNSGVVYSVKLDGEQLDFYPDADLRHLTLESLSSNPSVLNVSGYIVNSGDVALTRIRINRFFGLGICNPALTYLELENILILPGDSLMFEMNAPLFYSPNNGDPFFHCCVFSTSPGNLSDRDESNDIVCGSRSLVGIFDITKSHNINLFPNPTSEKIAFQLDFSPQNSSYSIFDLLGRVVKTGSIANTSNPEIDIRNLETGSYVLHLQTDDSQYAGKFVVVR